jgi:hypothetical protein
MSGASAKRDLGTGDKTASSGRTHSRESAHKHKEESSHHAVADPNIALEAADCKQKLGLMWVVEVRPT